MRSSVSACVFKYLRVLARVPACVCASARVYSREYPRVHVRVLTCDSCATREGCQVARERHCVDGKHCSSEVIHVHVHVPPNIIPLQAMAVFSQIDYFTCATALGQSMPVYFYSVCMHMYMYTCTDKTPHDVHVHVQVPHPVHSQ